MKNWFSKRNGDVMSKSLCVKSKYSSDCVNVVEGILKLTLIPSQTATMLLLVFSLLNGVQSATQITGTVLDADSKTPLKNALVSLKSTGDLVLTDENGKFVISHTANISQNSIRGENTNSIRLKNGVLSLFVEKQNSKIELKTFTLTGKQLSSVSYTLSAGIHSIAISNFRSAAGTILCKLNVNAQVYTFPHTSTLSYTITTAHCNSVTSTRPNGRAASMVDTLIVSKYLYTPITTPVTSTIYLKKPSTPTPPPGMKTIPGGKFMRGSSRPFAEVDEQPIKEITISSFFIDSTEVTQADYFSLFRNAPWLKDDVTIPTPFPGSGNNYPVWNINWYDAALYCNARSKRDGLDTVYTYDSINGSIGYDCVLANITTNFGKNGYRLPTEAEWEYAARSGTITDYYWGNYTKQDLITPKKYAWYSTNIVSAVAMKIPNSFGLYDMSGNVYEFANDYYHVRSYTTDDIIDPKGVPITEYRVQRGGYWASFDADIRSSDRMGIKPTDAYYVNGFRVALPNK